MRSRTSAAVQAQVKLVATGAGIILPTSINRSQLKTCAAI
jgi:hypothetical protein